MTTTKIYAFRFFTPWSGLEMDPLGRGQKSSPYIRCELIFDDEQTTPLFNMGAPS